MRASKLLDQPDWPTVACRLSTYPADFVGETKRGRIEKGASADFVIIDNEHDLDVIGVVVEGEAVET